MYIRPNVTHPTFKGKHTRPLIAKRQGTVEWGEADVRCHFSLQSHADFCVSVKDDKETAVPKLQISSVIGKCALF